MAKENSKALEPSVCPIVRSIEEIGDKWTLMIIRESFFGVSRFDEFQQGLNISKSVLTNRLNKLVQAGLLEKQAYQEENSRTRYEYVLTDKGADLQMLLVALQNWGNKHLVKEGEETIGLQEKKGSKEVKLRLLNSKGKKVKTEKLRWKRMVKGARPVVPD